MTRRAIRSEQVSGVHLASVDHLQNAIVEVRCADEFSFLKRFRFSFEAHLAQAATEARLRIKKLLFFPLVVNGKDGNSGPVIVFTTFERVGGNLNFPSLNHLDLPINEEILA